MITKSDDGAAGVQFVITSMVTDDTKSYYQLIIKITIPEKTRMAKLWEKGKICTKMLTKETTNILRPPLPLRSESRPACLPFIILKEKNYDWKTKIIFGGSRGTFQLTIFRIHLYSRDESSHSLIKFRRIFLIILVFNGR